MLILIRSVGVSSEGAFTPTNTGDSDMDDAVTTRTLAAGDDAATSSALAPVLWMARGVVAADLGLDPAPAPTPAPAP